MSFIRLLQAEFQKIRRSHIIWLLLAATVLLWVPSVANAHLNFEMQAEGISPEHNFFIQGFLGFCWFLFPSCMVVVTVMLNQAERNNRGILKMLTLPVSTSRLCLAKFFILLTLAALQILLAVGIYLLSAAIASKTQAYPFLLPQAFLWKEAGLIFITAVPMLSVFWMLSVCIRIPVFAIGAGLAGIVPSVLAINTKIWFLDPMAYPFCALTAEYGRLAAHLPAFEIAFIPWIPVSLLLTAGCLWISCLCFGQAERR